MNRLVHRCVLGVVALLVSAMVPACMPAANVVTSPLPAATVDSPIPSETPAPTSTPGPAPVYTYKIVNVYPHDRAAFTEGLVYADGIFYESIGLNGQSALRKVQPATGAVLKSLPLSDEYFGEGITVYGDRIIQLTWQTHVGFVYNKDSFELLREFSYPTEGWGLTHDRTHLIMSDGTSTLHFLNPDTLEEIDRIEVTDNGVPVVRLNELEYVRGEIFANVWRTDRIARIDPRSGRVTGWIDLTGLLSAEDRAQRVDVLNGIAYDAEKDRLFVTGKWWPKLLEIEVFPRP